MKFNPFLKRIFNLFLIFYCTGFLGISPAFTAQRILGEVFKHGHSIRKLPCNPHSRLFNNHKLYHNVIGETLKNPENNEFRFFQSLAEYDNLNYCNKLVISNLNLNLVHFYFMNNVAKGCLIPHFMGNEIGKNVYVSSRLNLSPQPYCQSNKENVSWYEYLIEGKNYHSSSHETGKIFFFVNPSVGLTTDSRNIPFRITIENCQGKGWKAYGLAENNDIFEYAKDTGNPKIQFREECIY